MAGAGGLDRVRAQLLAVAHTVSPGNALGVSVFRVVVGSISSSHTSLVTPQHHHPQTPHFTTFRHPHISPPPTPHHHPPNTTSPSILNPIAGRRLALRGDLCLGDGLLVLLVEALQVLLEDARELESLAATVMRQQCHEYCV